MWRLWLCISDILGRLVRALLFRDWMNDLLFLKLPASHATMWEFIPIGVIKLDRQVEKTSTLEGLGLLKNRTLELMAR